MRCHGKEMQLSAGAQLPGRRQAGQGPSCAHLHARLVRRLGEAYRGAVDKQLDPLGRLHLKGAAAVGL